MFSFKAVSPSCTPSSVSYALYLTPPPQAHEPASCSNMQKWVESGGFYEGMDEDAKSKQLASVIAKKCPGCNAPIEKNEGCLQ